jgi:hypothetical protein
MPVKRVLPAAVKFAASATVGFCFAAGWPLVDRINNER